MARSSSKIVALVALLAGMLALVANPPRAAADGEGPVPVIDLYTMGQGKHLVEAFGHVALCVCYPELGQEGCVPARPRPRRRRPGDNHNVCYNYGTTDFSHPMSLGWGFLRSRAEFWVEPWDPARMVRIYTRYDRSIWLQRLVLTPAQANKIAELLAYDVLPENRNYNYHHFYENCATRVRDIIDAATGGKLRENSSTKPGPSFRDYSRRGFADFTWMLVVTDLIMGRKGDIVPTLWQAMFLPRYLRQHVTDQLGVEPVLIYERKGPPFDDDPGNRGRGWIMLFALIALIPIVATRLSGRFQRLGLIPAAAILFAVGLIIWFMAAVSTLAELRYNEALFVFVPFDIVLPFLGDARRLRYAQIRIAGLMLVSVLLGVGLFLQPLWISILAVALPLAAIAVPEVVVARLRPAAKG
jgi:hypothetical protein